MRVLHVSVPLPTEDRPNTTAPIARQIDSLRQVGVDIDHLEVDGPARLKYVSMVPELRRRASRADVVHAHFGYCGWLARTQRSAPVVVSFMGTDLLGHPMADGRITTASRIPVAINRRFARMVDEVIVKSEEMANVVAPTPAHVVPNGVDVERFHPIDKLEARRVLGWPEHGRCVLFPGNPRNPRKNHPLAREAVEHATQALGDPIELKVLHEVDPATVPLVMNACDAMVMLSYLEGSPNVVKEAMACNVPVVAVPVGDVASLLDGVVGGELCARNPTDIGEAIARVLESDSEPTARVKIIDSGLDLESVTRRLIGIYERALA